MQADPYIQAPGNLQSYNRYSYVINNPLSLTDPSGYNWWSDLWKSFGRIVLAVAVAWVTAGWGSSWYLSSLGITAQTAGIGGVTAVASV
ncbi:MAG: hypothetical protein HY028_11960 [Gammaproteobacteria bacterium]|nr:hypothetical protein [Gammaproteobacteria bacterium]